MPKNPAAVALGRLGGRARACRLSAEEQSEAGRRAVTARWARRRAQRAAADAEVAAGARWAAEAAVSANPTPKTVIRPDRDT